MSKTKANLKSTQVFSEALPRMRSNIQYLLTQNHLTQNQLADEIGISHQTISKYLNSCETFPSLRRIIEIAEALGVTPDALLYHDLQSEYSNISYEDDIAATLLRPTIIPECVLRRYRKNAWYMYYYTTKDDHLQLCEAYIRTENDIKMQYIKASIITESQTHAVKVVVDYPRYIYLYGINENNPTRFFIMFSDPDYTKQDADYLGGLAICVSIIPENSTGLPGMQFVALSSRKLDITKYEEQLYGFLELPQKKHLLRLHLEQNKEYVDWLRKQLTS